MSRVRTELRLTRVSRNLGASEVERGLGRELPRSQSQVEASSREDMVTQGKGALGSPSVGYWGHI